MSISITLLGHAPKKKTGYSSGAGGEGGTDKFLHLAWADSEDGEGFTKSNLDVNGHIVGYKYLGMCLTDELDDETLSFNNYAWTYLCPCGECSDSSTDNPSDPSSGGGTNPSDPSSGGGGSDPSTGGGGTNPSDPSSGGGTNPSDPSSGGGGTNPSDPSSGGGSGNQDNQDIPNGEPDYNPLIDIITGFVIGTLTDLFNTSRWSTNVVMCKGRASYNVPISEAEDGHLFITEYGDNNSIIGNYTYYKSVTVGGKTYNDIWMDTDRVWRVTEYNPITHEYRNKYFQGAAFKIPEVSNPRFIHPKVEPKYFHPTCLKFYSYYDPWPEDGYYPLDGPSDYWSTIENWESNCPLVEANLEAAYVPTI